jgi:ribosomal protein S6
MAMAIAEHNPGKLYKKNKGLLKMSHTQLHEFASTPRKKLAYKISIRGHKP